MLASGSTVVNSVPWKCVQSVCGVWCVCVCVVCACVWCVYMHMVSSVMVIDNSNWVQFCTFLSSNQLHKKNICV